MIKPGRNTRKQTWQTNATYSAMILDVNLEGPSRYEQATALPLAILGIVFLAVYAWPILDPHLPPVAESACTAISLTIWAVFLADYVIRLALAPHRLRFIRHHWLDLVILGLPMLRPLRALRGVVGLRILGRSGTPFARGRVVAAIAATIGAGAAIAALAMLDAERANPAANIQSYGDAPWWAMSTISNVGYGDRYPPTTTEGRLVAATLMIAGIALLGVVTAALASWFVQRIGEVTRAEQDTQTTLHTILEQIDALRRELEQTRNPPT